MDLENEKFRRGDQRNGFRVALEGTKEEKNIVYSSISIQNSLIYVKQESGG